MSILGPDPIADEVEHLLDRLERGDVGGAPLESAHVDLKEEAGRRGAQGQQLPPVPEDRVTAKQLAGEAVCMANSPGGGVLVVGADDDGTVLGTGLDAEWLRRTIYDLTQGRLTVAVSWTTCRGERLLLVRSPEAVQPIAWQHKYRWRVDDSCVEIDASTWEQERRRRTGYDWSGQVSPRTLVDVRPAAVQRARDLLRQAGDDRSADLLRATDADLLRRLVVLSVETSGVGSQVVGSAR